MSHRKIGNVMSTDVATVRRDTPFKDIVRTLEQRDVSAAPVVDEKGHVLGVVSQADLLVKQGVQEPDWTRSPMNWWRRRHNARRAEATTAADLMTRPAITITEKSTVVSAARELTRHNIKRLPVIDDDGKLVGIVSRKDLLTVFLRKDEDIRADIIHNVFEFGLGMPVNPSVLIVTVHDGIVTLEGQIELKSQLSLVESMTRHTDGVVDVTMKMNYLRDDTHDAYIPPPMSVDITHAPYH
jgi:CBS domain-containing protein